MDQKEKILENLTGELKRGTLVLSVLLNTDAPTYGYSLVKNLQDIGIDIEQNTLYPLLRRLEKQDLLTSSWDTSESRPRKYYQISPFGREIRTELATQWLHSNDIMQQMIESAGQAQKEE